MKLIIVAEDADTHIKGCSQNMNMTLCGFVDVAMKFIESNKVTCIGCLSALKHVRGLIEGKDY